MNENIISKIKGRVAGSAHIGNLKDSVVNLSGHVKSEAAMEAA